MIIFCCPTRCCEQVLSSSSALVNTVSFFYFRRTVTTCPVISIAFYHEYIKAQRTYTAGKMSIHTVDHQTLSSCYRRVLDVRSK